MDFRFVPLWVSAAFCLFWLGIDSRQHVGAVAREADAFHGLRSRVAEERDQARLRLRSERRVTIELLLRLARSDEKEPHLAYAKLTALELLAEYRAVEAGEFLVNEIEYSPAFIEVREDHPLNGYPAAKALVHIGEPVIPAIITRLGRAAFDDQLRIFAWVIYLIDGKEVGLYRLEHTLAETAPGLERKRENLLRLIEIYKAPSFEHRKSWPRPDR